MLGIGKGLLYVFSIYNGFTSQNRTWYLGGTEYFRMNKWMNGWMNGTTLRAPDENIDGGRITTDFNDFELWTLCIIVYPRLRKCDFPFYCWTVLSAGRKTKVMKIRCALSRWSGGFCCSVSHLFLLDAREATKLEVRKKEPEGELSN